MVVKHLGIKTLAFPNFGVPVHNLKQFAIFIGGWFVGTQGLDCSWDIHNWHAHSSQIQANNQTNKPLVFMNCGIHAREWVSPATCMYVVDQVAELFAPCSVCAFMFLLDFFFSIKENSINAVGSAWLGARLWLLHHPTGERRNDYEKNISRVLHLIWKSPTLVSIRVDLSRNWNPVSRGTLKLFLLSLEL